MDRRRLLLSAGAVAMAGPVAAAPLPVPPAGRIAFKVLRNGTPIGEHHLAFSQGGDALSVAIHAAFLVRIAGIPVFRYVAAATEIWSGGVFQSLESRVNDNGNKLQVHAHRVEN